MAPKSTIFKVNLSVADITRGYYEDHALTIARHPSETDLRMVVRILVFALNAHEYLKFGKGLSTTEEPDLWQVDLTGEVDHWIDLGQPTEKRLRQACSKARLVSVYTYQKGAAGPWFDDIKDSLERFKHLSIKQLTIADESMIPRVIDRTMVLNCTIEEDQIALSNAEHCLNVSVKVMKELAPQ